jgi:hypothetical protein
MKAPIFLLFLIFFFIQSCTIYKFKYGDRDPKLKDFLPESEMVYLIFKKDFKNEHIKVFEGNNLIFEGGLIDSQEKPKVLMINKINDVTIKFSSIKKTLIITPKIVKDYNVIYFYKNKKNVYIYMHDGSMTPYHESTLLRNHDKKSVYCKILEIDPTPQSVLRKYIMKSSAKSPDFAEFKKTKIK